MIVIGQRGKRRLRSLDAVVPINRRICGTRIGRSGDSRDLWVRLQFEAAGQAVDEEISVSTPFFKKAKQAGYTRVKCNPEDPADFLVVEDRSARAEPTLFIVFGALFILVGIGVGIIGLIALASAGNSAL